jgi:hypothetical protein
MLRDHGLRGVCFVETLFAARFGIDPLAEIVGLIRAAGQDVQLHLHPEWVDEIDPPPVAASDGKRQFLWQFSRDEQVELLRAGRALLEHAGAPPPTAFRAGNFALAQSSWQPLAQTGLRFDSSYNGARIEPASGLSPDFLPTQPFVVDGVHEYPVSIYSDGLGRLRHAQISGSSYGELEALLWHAAEAGWHTVNIVSHSFELLTSNKARPDSVAVKRYRRLCEFLDRNRDTFTTSGFDDLTPEAVRDQPPIAELPARLTALRAAEQAWRRLEI